MTKPNWTTIIADNDPEDARLLHSLLNHHCPQVQVKAAVSKIPEAIERIAELKAGLVFCNVSLHDGSAFDLMEQMKNFNGHLVLLSTNELDALRAFRYHAFDFLLKPVTSEVLIDVVKRLPTSPLYPDILEQPEESPDGKKFGTIILKVAGVQHLVQINDIAHLEGDGNYSTVHLTSGEKILVSKPLKHFEEILPAKLFYRVHQSHIVNLSNVKSVQNGDVHYINLKNGETAPLSRRKRESFLAWLGKQVIR